MLISVKSWAQKYKKNEDGAFAIMASICMLMMVVSVGAAIDIANAHKSKEKLQSLSDSVGLAAAIYMRDHQTPPTNSKDGYIDDAIYDIQNANFGKTIGNMRGSFVVNYNDELGQAEVKFSADAETIFLKAFHTPKMELKVGSVVKYVVDELPATSVFMVVDNSGSMAWDDKPIVPGHSARPNGAKTRIQGLKDTALEFSENLDKALNASNSPDQKRSVRTALIPYSTDVISSKQVEPQWGVLSETDLDKMRASGGTDSRGPLEQANKWMELEDQKHQAESGEKNPKKYVIFMTDGSNNEEWICDWQNRRGTRLWRRHNGFRYNYSRARRSPGSGWTEGVAYNCNLENRSNSNSLAVCRDLEENGVEVFTIGFALEAGRYYAQMPYSNATTTISEQTTNAAYDFLKSCASSKEHFIKAEDTSALKEAFDKIGKKIAQDAIRIAG